MWPTFLIVREKYAHTHRTKSRMSRSRPSKNKRKTKKSPARRKKEKRGTHAAPAGQAFGLSFKKKEKALIQRTQRGMRGHAKTPPSPAQKKRGKIPSRPNANQNASGPGDAAFVVLFPYIPLILITIECEPFCAFEPSTAEVAKAEEEEEVVEEKAEVVDWELNVEGRRGPPGSAAVSVSITPTRVWANFPLLFTPPITPPCEEFELVGPKGIEIVLTPTPQPTPPRPPPARGGARGFLVVPPPPPSPNPVPMPSPPAAPRFGSNRVSTPQEKLKRKCHDHAQITTRHTRISTAQTAMLFKFRSKLFKPGGFDRHRNPLYASINPAQIWGLLFAVTSELGSPLAIIMGDLSAVMVGIVNMIIYLRVELQCARPDGSHEILRRWSWFLRRLIGFQDSFTVSDYQFSVLKSKGSALIASICDPIATQREEIQINTASMVSAESSWLLYHPNFHGVHYADPLHFHFTEPSPHTCRVDSVEILISVVHGPQRGAQQARFYLSSNSLYPSFVIVAGLTLERSRF
ncbi:hypothetical protein B0H16DRAFT_1471712 [Mycena metata]|uniref:Uncharacterized protein n=1 Tax=Mycena metata TaxID=1033252 RepID=A0AAD7MP41_9AGAR|nr:hypothetical protein B0H16DRAFT_1471712 [Mycena metata]